MGSPLSLFCCSYKRDYLRCRRLIESVTQFNSDLLPFVLSVPSADTALFADIARDHGVELVSQEDLWASTPSAAKARFSQVPGGLRQQVLKSEAWRLVDAEVILVLDSDCVFIRPFALGEMISLDDGIPFTVAHDGSSYLEFVRDFGPQRGIHEHERDRAPIRELFGNTETKLDFGYAPFIWSRRVWEEFDQRYLKPHNQTLLEFFQRHPQEFTVYGEALLSLRSIPFRPIPPLFKPYHYEHEYWLDQWKGIQQEDIAREYMGVVYQSNWQFDWDYEPPIKSFPSRAALRWRRSVRWLLTKIRFKSLPTL